jgi:metal-responsive CopG/Arc/MetJ family transcriptional regulator
MKIKTSVSLSKELLCKIDEAVGAGGNRSDFIERVVKQHLRRVEREASGRSDIEIYARLARDQANLKETEETLAWSIPWWELGDEVEIAEG